MSPHLDKTTLMLLKELPSLRPLIKILTEQLGWDLRGTQRVALWAPGNKRHVMSFLLDDRVYSLVVNHDTTGSPECFMVDILCMSPDRRQFKDLGWEYVPLPLEVEDQLMQTGKWKWYLPPTTPLGPIGR